MNQRPALEVLSWIAGIVSTCLAVYLFLKPEQTNITKLTETANPAQPAQPQKPQQPQQVPPVQQTQSSAVIHVPKIFNAEPRPSQRRLQDDPAIAAMLRKR